MAPHIPDEVVSEILSPALKVSESMFSDTESDVSPFATPHVSSSAYLLVCKAWRRVGTPLLYQAVIIRSTAQARALQRTLHSNPDFGKFVNKLRVEGGFGVSMEQLLKHTPKLTDIFLSLMIRGSDSTSGLVRGLPHINPTRLIVFEPPPSRGGQLKNIQVADLVKALEKALPMWTNLADINFPYFSPVSGGIRQDLVTVASSRDTVQRISFSKLTTIDIPFLASIAARPTLKVIQIRNIDAFESEKLISDVAADPRLKQLVQWPETPETPPDPTALWVANLSFQAFKNSPQEVVDRIWSCILGFAVPAPYAQARTMFFTSNPNATHHDWDIRYGRRRYLTVSKTFCRLALPYLYHTVYLQLPATLHAFYDRLTSTPALGMHLRGMKLHSQAFQGGAEYHADMKNFFQTMQALSRRGEPAPATVDANAPPVDMSVVFHHARCLKRLLGEPRHPRPGEMPCLPWADFVALAQAAGSTMEEISNFAFEQPDINHGPAVFQQFSALRSFTWACDAGGSQWDDSQESLFVERVPADGFPALESLHLASSGALIIFTAMDLPKLRRLEFTGQFNPKCHAGDAFLQKHGPKVEGMSMQLLEVEGTPFSGHSVLKLCPRMTVFSCELQSIGGDYFNFAKGTFAPGIQHMSLTTLSVSKKPLQANLDDRAWKKFFDSLKLTHLPSLREIRVGSFEGWPTNEFDISKSVFVKLAERLLPSGVHLTERNGARWHPRLKK
ncbi:hypothetical protein C8F04DRAFT_1403080 [Mycena alexandri]|uniref:Uncharacterized protein n=1 Tax=Mycena alexandri TaxID=1745969 RepID=A0AAD6S4V6_9AGAR|nr:hypothetical protein C8F04DRAFT_1403080 [Mycena alexandri]